MKKSTEIPSYFSLSGHRHLKPMLATLILALFISPAAMSAGIYKWTDEKGEVHYGSERPEDAQAEKMQLHIPEPATPPASQQEAKAEGQEADPKNEATLKDDGDQEKANKERTAYCANERKRLQTIDKNPEIHEKNTKGEVQKLSAEARKQRLDKIKANISQYCK